MNSKNDEKTICFPQVKTTKCKSSMRPPVYLKCFRYFWLITILFLDEVVFDSPRSTSSKKNINELITFTWIATAYRSMRIRSFNRHTNEQFLFSLFLFTIHDVRCCDERVKRWEKLNTYINVSLFRLYF